MRDFPVVLAGLAVFLSLATLPFWYNAMAKTPPLVLPPTTKQCVLPSAELRRSHMQILDHQRDRVVREGIRTQTCLEQCHQSNIANCDNCHAYVGLRRPDCFSCHNSPAIARLQP